MTPADTTQEDDMAKSNPTLKAARALERGAIKAYKAQPTDARLATAVKAGQEVKAAGR